MRLTRLISSYAQILQYLRAPSFTGLETLPRSVQLLPLTQSRYELLLELRDEAHFLDLDGLYKLCEDELRRRPVPRPQHAGKHSIASSSIHSMQASMHSGWERAESTDPRRSHTSQHATYAKHADEARNLGSPPTPRSFTGRLASRSRSPPAHAHIPNYPTPSPGWI